MPDFKRPPSESSEVKKFREPEPDPEETSDDRKRWGSTKRTIIEPEEPKSPRTPKPEERDPRKNPDGFRYGFDRDEGEGKEEREN